MCVHLVSMSGTYLIYIFNEIHQSQKFLSFFNTIGISIIYYNITLYIITYLEYEFIIYKVYLYYILIK